MENDYFKFELADYVNGADGTIFTAERNSILTYDGDYSDTVYTVSWINEYKNIRTVVYDVKTVNENIYEGHWIVL